MYLLWGVPYNQIWRLILHLLRRSFPKIKWVFLRIPIYSAFMEADHITNMKVDSAFIEADHIIKFEGWFCIYLRRTSPPGTFIFGKSWYFAICVIQNTNGSALLSWNSPFQSRLKAILFVFRLSVLRSTSLNQNGIFIFTLKDVNYNYDQNIRSVVQH